MKLKNNSDKEWLNYNCGDNIYVDIKPGAIFEVDNKTGQFLLRVLGHTNWLTMVDDIAEQPILIPMIDEKVVKVFCEECLSKNYRHKKSCSKVSLT